MSAIYTNQFAQSVVQGDLDLGIMQTGSVAGILSPNNGSSILAGAPAKIDTTITTGYVINFLQAAQTDIAVGFFVRTAKQATFNLLDQVQVALAPLPVLWLTANATITPGQAVQNDSTGAFVQPLASGKQRGIALDYAINGGMTRVLLLAPLAAAS